MGLDPDVSKGHCQEEVSATDQKSGEEQCGTTAEINSSMNKIANDIATGADAFLWAEYRYMAVFVVLFSALLLVFLGVGSSFEKAIYTVIAFLFGSISSVVSGFIGMRIAVEANVRTAAEAYRCGKEELGPPFLAAFKGGAVMGFGLVSIALINMFLLILFYSLYVFPNAFDGSVEDTQLMFECVAGFGLGGSAIALFGRVGGGIYTKAADVGADQVKLDAELGWNEDDPRNPAVIADNVGDNVGDIAGMGADLFGSLAESSCAAMIISATSPDLHSNWAVMCFPMLVAASGIPVSLLTSLFATECSMNGDQGNLTAEERKQAIRDKIDSALKYQLILSTFLMTPVLYFITAFTFPAVFTISTVENCTSFSIFTCLAAGLWSGLAIGLMTEYYTSSRKSPVKNLARESNGAALNIIHGLALGYESVIVPISFLALTVYLNYHLAGMYGVACGALGMLSTLAIGLTIDAYGPICDNAGGIAEMSHMPANVRDNKTDPLDAAGNTTAAIGKGFAIGSAALVSLALFGAFVTVKLPQGEAPVVNVLDSLVFAGVLMGAMLPYWFSAMTMKSVGSAANKMVQEVERQIELMKAANSKGQHWEANYTECVKISTDASLSEMIPPGILVMGTPLLAGYLFGPKCLAGLLVGILTSGVQVAISASNSGGAWDNAKKFVKDGNLANEDGFVTRWNNPDFPEKQKQFRRTFVDATVVGDTVGDPLKDTSGPAINILVKLSAITSLVFASSMPNWDQDGFVLRLFTGSN
jgi:inorganic pyrophosphatase